MQLEVAWKGVKLGEHRERSDGYRVTVERLDGKGVRAEEVATVISLLADNTTLWNEQMRKEEAALSGELRGQMFVVTASK